MVQTALLCGCGGGLKPHLDADQRQVGSAHQREYASLERFQVCPRCARRARLNREMFAGEREPVLHRDGYSCQACGSVDLLRLVVHHRKPGVSRRKWLVAICRRCHVRVHHLHRPTYGLVREWPVLYALWREIHSRQPEQLLLTAARDAQQLELRA